MDPKRKLKGMLARIFSDATATPSERQELEAFMAESGLDASAIREVVDDFVKTTWKITMADGIVSEREKDRLREIVAVLGLSKSPLPAEWAALLPD